MIREAPVLRDATRLTTWVLSRFDAVPGALARRCSESALDLHERVALALRHGERELVLDADDALLRLRLGLRLARDLDQLDDRQLLHALGLADDVGRQLGGWLRKIAA